MSLIPVVILSKKPANLQRCLLSLQKDANVSPIVVNDADNRIEMARALNYGGCYFQDYVMVQGARPFIFSRNANKGIKRANIPGATGVVLMNDDAALESEDGLTNMVAAACMMGQEFGVVSASIRGMVNNPEQMYVKGAEQQIINPRPIRALEKECSLAFVCVYIPFHVFDVVGLLDERFEGYGFEDNDFCCRVLKSGFKLGVYDQCVVEHGSVASTFRHDADGKAITPDCSRGLELFKSIHGHDTHGWWNGPGKV